MLSPLHLAALNGHLEVCKFIMSKIEDKNPRTLGEGPRDWGYEGQLEGYRLIIKVVGNKIATGKVGETPLHLAAEKGHSDICRLILESVEDRETLNCQNEDGETALDVAMNQEYRNQEVVELLESFGVGNRLPSRRNDYGRRFQEQ